MLVGGVQVIDSSYRGEIILTVKNMFSDIIRINGQWGLRLPLAQLIIQPYRFERLEIFEENTHYEKKQCIKYVPNVGRISILEKKCDCGEEIMEKQTPPVAAAIVPKHEREV